MSWKLSTELEPNYDGGLMRAKWLRGGMRYVKTKSQRNAIPKLYRHLDAFESTLCFVEEDSQVFKLISNATETTTDADWEVITFGAISNFKPIGTWDPNNIDPYLQDTGAANLNGDFYFVINTPVEEVVSIPGLFGDVPVTVVDGNMIVSVGDKWTVVANNLSWDSIDKPQVITDYVNGIVIPHTHSASDITDLATYLTDYLKRTDTADHTIAFNSVSDSAIIELEFLKQWYYTKTTVDSTFLKKTGDSGVQLFTFANNQGIDSDLSGSTDVLNIGTTNADVINIGRAGAVVNIFGTVNYEEQTNLAIENKLILLNNNGAAASGSNSGFEIEENNIITGYFMTNGTRDGYLMKAGGSFEGELSLDLLTANRSYEFPDVSGTIALAESTLSTSLDSAKFWLGDGTNTAVQRLLSGDATMSNTGALTIASDAITTGKILNTAVTYAKIQNVTTDKILGRDTAGSGVVEEIGVGGGIEFTGSLALQIAAFTGDVTKIAGGTALTISNNAVTYAKIQNVSATNRLLGRITGGAGVVEELTGTQATTLLNVFTDSLQGLTPASGGGTSNFLRADGSWAAPGGSGHAIYNDSGLLSQRANLRFQSGLTPSDDDPDTLVELGGSLLKDTLIDGNFKFNVDSQNFGLFSSAPDFNEGEKIMFMGVCTTPPVTPPTQGVYIFVQLINSNYELRIMDSAGNIKGIS